MAKRKDEKKVEFEVVYGIVEREGEKYWTRLGVAFVNSDGSRNLKLDFLPVSTEIDIHIRKPKPKEEAKAE